MPFAFAHPAAVVPLAKLLGRNAVPSALAIGSMIPDAWYLVPMLERADSHDAPLALLFCLPAGVIAYAAFHLFFKRPMLALLPRDLAGRLAAWSTPGLPRVPFLLVLVSLLAGIVTHLTWDVFTHAGHFAFQNTRLVPGVRVHHVLQHASTLLGCAFLAWWLWRKLRATPPRPELRELQPRVRVAVVAAMLLVPLIAFVAALQAFEAGPLRAAVRAAGVSGLYAFGALALLFCLAWKRWLRAGG